MFVVDRLFVGGIKFVLDKIAAAVDAELNDADRLRERLLDAQARHEVGEIDAAELAAIEAQLLERLAELRRAERGDEAGLRVTGVEVTFGGDPPPEESERGPRGV